LPKAMSISRSEIFRKKEKKDQKMKKVLESHGSSMGGERRSVECHGRSLKFFSSSNF